MSDQTIMVNQIPSLTWHRLHINEAYVEPAEELPQYLAPEAQLPDDVDASEERNFSSSAQTGMGEALGILIKKAGIPVFSCEAKADVKDPVRLNYSCKNGENTLSAAELTVSDGCEMTVIMIFRAEKDAKGRSGIQTRYHVGAAGKLHLVQIQMLGDGMNFYNDIGGECDENGRFELTQLMLAGHHTYYGIRSLLSGKKSSQKTDLAYQVSGDGLFDVNEVVQHTGKKTDCQINASGVLRDHAKKTFRGTIDFVRGCAGSTGNELEDVLLLDDPVVNQTLPVILCAEEDVAGNHGASIGRIDEDLLFYLNSRGIDDKAVEEMMARAKIDRVKNLIPDPKSACEVDRFMNL